VINGIRLYGKVETGGEGTRYVKHSKPGRRMVGYIGGGQLHFDERRVMGSAERRQLSEVTESGGLLKRPEHYLRSVRCARGAGNELSSWKE